MSGRSPARKFATFVQTLGKMQVLITGADGLLGSNIVRVALDKGYRVRAFVLPDSPSKTLDGLPIERVEGNLLNPGEVQQAVQGCEYVIHAAANTNVWPSRGPIYRKVNYDGTRHVAEACQRENVKRLVVIGSAAAFPPGTREKPADETVPMADTGYGLDYISSKREAQEYILREARENGLPALIICPTFMFGPYDSKPSGGAMIVGVVKRQAPGYPISGGKNFVHARDVAVAAVNGLTMGRTGEIYLAGNENLSYKEIFAKIGRIAGVKPPALPMPSFVLLAVGAVGSFLGKTFGFQPKITLPMARVACDGQYFSARKAVQELNMPQTPIEQAIEEAIDWMKQNGLL